MHGQQNIKPLCSCHFPCFALWLMIVRGIFQ